MKRSENIVESLYQTLVKVISETNGISLRDTLEILLFSQEIKDNPSLEKLIAEFQKLLFAYTSDELDIETLLAHNFSKAMEKFFTHFPLKYYEEHIHLTGSLDSEFIFPRLQKLLKGKNAKIYEKKITEVYGKEALPITSEEDVDRLIILKEGEHFLTYLRILYLAKLVLIDRKAHEEAAYHLASKLYHQQNVGHIRLKFTLSRSTSESSEVVPGSDNIAEKDVVLGLYAGFTKFKKEFPDFNFVLSPCFRKEAKFFDHRQFKSKRDHFLEQVNNIQKLLGDHPELKSHLCEVDTVGDEKELYRKKHFEELREGLRKLQFLGLKIKSHHGETWKNLRKGVQSVDNAMNIWHIDTLEHGLSLGVNPNYYFHRIYQRTMDLNRQSLPVENNSPLYYELEDMSWDSPDILRKLFQGQKLSAKEEELFIKTKFHTAREVEHYQHDVLNRMINKNISLVALPSSNMKLTECFPDYKDHPFSWWEKKGVGLGIGTDNYVTLDTSFIKEMLILLYSDPDNLKVTKLLMVATKEKRRPFMSHLLWQMRAELLRS